MPERIDPSRRFDDPDVRASLHKLDFTSLVDRLGEPEIVTKYAQGLGNWKLGDGRPALADDDPAVMAAIGRCAASRVRWQWTPGLSGGGAVHPARCGWCDYPLPMLLTALEYATYINRLVVVEIALWRQSDAGPGRYVTYKRSTGREGYSSAAWSDFEALAPAVQRDRVAQIINESRKWLGEREHAPWCVSEPEHPGDCVHPAE